MSFARFSLFSLCLFLRSSQIFRRSWERENETSFFFSFFLFFSLFSLFSSRFDFFFLFLFLFICREREKKKFIDRWRRKNGMNYNHSILRAALPQLIKGKVSAESKKNFRKMIGRKKLSPIKKSFSPDCLLACLRADFNSSLFPDLFRCFFSMGKKRTKKKHIKKICRRRRRSNLTLDDFVLFQSDRKKQKIFACVCVFKKSVKLLWTQFKKKLEKFVSRRPHFFLLEASALER